MKNCLIYLAFILILISCNGYVDQNPADKLSKMDNLFISGFKMELEQVYIMNGENVLPYLDTPKDSAFKNGYSKITFNEFIDYDVSKDTIFRHIVKNEIWDIESMKTVYDTTYIEHGYGSSYFITTMIASGTHNIISCSNEYETRDFLINVKISDIYSYRGNDNHFFMVQNIKNGSVYKSNLYFEVLTKNGCGLFGDDKYIYLDTNPIMTFSRQITAPLTGSQVKLEIEKGNYVLYLYNGMTTYKIGDNLYIPRYSSYVYIGTVNTNGMIVNLESKYYRLKFRVR